MRFRDDYEAARFQDRLWTPVSLDPDLMLLARSQFLSIASGNVATAFDLSRNKRNASQATAGTRPAFSPTVDGGAINVATNKVLALDETLTQNDFTLFTLVRQIDGAMFIPFDSPNSAAQFTSDLAYMWYSGWGAYWTSYKSPNEIVSSTFSGLTSHCIRRSGTAGSFWVNNSRTNFTATTAGRPTRYPVGQIQNSLSTNYYLYSAIAFGKALSDADISKVFAWMAWERAEYGFVPALLPASHRFRHRPPLKGD